MTCSSCVSALESYIRESLPGVHSVSASHALSRAVVEYDATKCTEAQILKAIEELGYKASVSREKISSSSSTGM